MPNNTKERTYSRNDLVTLLKAFQAATFQENPTEAKMEGGGQFSTVFLDFDKITRTINERVTAYYASKPEFPKSQAAAKAFLSAYYVYTSGGKSDRATNKQPDTIKPDPKIAKQVEEAAKKEKERYESSGADKAMPKPKPPPAKKAPPPEQIINLCEPLKGKEWGVRFKYTDRSIPGKCSKGTTIDNSTVTTYKEWYLSLLPAMKSVIPLQGGMDTPNAMPGLQYRITNSISKHRIPGFQPIYQNMGIDSLYITIVGTFTGDGGLGLLDTRMNPGQEVTGLTPAGDPSDSPTRREKEEVNAVKTTGVTTRRYTIIDPKDKTAIPINVEAGAPLYKLADKVVFKYGETYYSYDNRTGNAIKEVSSREQVGPLHSTDGIVTTKATKLDSKEKYSTEQVTRVIAGNEGFSIEQRQPKTYTPGLFLKDACPDPCEVLNPDPKTKISSPMKASDRYRSEAYTNLRQIASRLDAYQEFTSFYNLAFRDGRELEVEINLRKYDDGLRVIPNEVDHPLRNGANGNPSFKGYVRRAEIYHARADRTWYLIEFEVTDHGLSSKQPINLTNDITNLVDNALNTLKEQREVSTKQQTDRISCLAAGPKTRLEDIKDAPTTRGAKGKRTLYYSNITGEGWTETDGKVDSNLMSPKDVVNFIATNGKDGVLGIGRRIDRNIKDYFNNTGIEIVQNNPAPDIDKLPKDPSSYINIENRLGSIGDGRTVGLELSRMGIDKQSGWGINFRGSKPIVMTPTQTLDQILVNANIISFRQWGAVDDIQLYMGYVTLKGKSIDCSVSDTPTTINNNVTNTDTTSKKSSPLFNSKRQQGAR